MFYSEFKVPSKSASRSFFIGHTLLSSCEHSRTITMFHCFTEWHYVLLLLSLVLKSMMKLAMLTLFAHSEGAIKPAVIMEHGVLSAAHASLQACVRK